MNMNDLHRRLLRDVLEVGNDLPLVITGGYAVQAHGIVDRMSRDIDVATNSSIPMEILALWLIEGLAERGWTVRVIGIEPVSARFVVTDTKLGQDCEVDILKEGFTRPPIDTPYGPVFPFTTSSAPRSVSRLADHVGRDLLTDTFFRRRYLRPPHSSCRFRGPRSTRACRGVHAVPCRAGQEAAGQRVRQPV
jgi:hypothetical protein